MNKRHFSLAGYGDRLDKFGDLDQLLNAPPDSGVKEVLVDGGPVHVLFEDRGFKTTIVHFAAALPKVGWDSFPVFGGRKFVRKFDANLLSISDPNFALPERPATGWFAGNGRQPGLQSVLARIISHYGEHGDGNVILFGSSAGGFAALLYGAQLPRSVTVCLNPRVELRNEPTQFHRLAPVAFPGVPAEAIPSIIQTSAAAAYAEALGNTVAYVQNVQDDPYFENNMVPFLTKVAAHPKVWLNLVDSGPGHRIPDPELTAALIRALIAQAPDWGSALEELAFHPAPTVDYALSRRKELIP